MPPTITREQLAGALQLRDLSDPRSGPHAMQLIVAAVTAAVEAEWRCPVHTYRASPIVTVAENYELLGYPADAPAREARYTRYLDDRRLLRTHTSAMIPQALRRMAGAGGDVAVACPGLVYRRDVVDRLHVGEPHQLDLWRVRPGPPLTAAELTEMVDLVVSAVRPRRPASDAPGIASIHGRGARGRSARRRFMGRAARVRTGCAACASRRRGSTPRPGRDSRSGSGSTAR